MQLKPDGRVWINTSEGAFMGYGRIELLEKIQTTGSLRKAALEMKMSYQQAWRLVTQMNERAGSPLVTFQRGGKNGGFARITPFGVESIKIFNDFNIAFQKFLEAQNLEIRIG